MRVFADRRDAGRVLAEKLVAYEGRDDLIVLGLPRGGVVVAFEVAKALRAPLDVYMVRKLGVPGQEELAFGAVASGGVRVLNDDVVRTARLDQSEIDAVTVREQAELERRERLYRGDRPALELQGKTAILVDDGLATGASMRTAILSLESHRPGWITMAVPTAPLPTCRELEREVDEAVCVMTPEPFFGVGQWYLDFSQTTDQEVIELLQEARDLVRQDGPARAADQGKGMHDEREPEHPDPRSGHHPGGGDTARRPPARHGRDRAGALRARQWQQPFQLPQPGRRP